MNKGNQPIDFQQARLRRAEQEAQKSYYQTMADANEHEAVAEHRFLAAWKKGVKLAGKGLFEVRRNRHGILHQSPLVIEDAHSKWQLCPRPEAVKSYVLTARRSDAIFMACLYSFYNDDDARKMLKKLNVGFAGLADILDNQRQKILADLLMYHRGW